MNADIVLAWLVAGLAGAAYLAALAYGVVQIARTRDLSRGERNLWIVGFLVFPLIASLVWFFAGPHPWGLRWGTPAFR
ncbi:PLDc N-terminal domain-containing protein [Mycetocola zhujimingii]|uniref:Cardiolipin synthase N-terminal domain-containing protein n=1 Tax=Mycetocola zhujimingii TaxID=2079792 RepID=A0A2U1TBM1_9MICO|nr:PLDc N-terminal domain-containing protein [Mycetocola zhujimingii]PWC06276.1 hypothetical protein DF223_11765 [Mycetocola zhujimingii]